VNILGNKPKTIITILIHGLFWFSYSTALWAFFEQCLNNGSPIWSTVLGFPFMHHGYYGFIGLIVAYFLLLLKNPILNNKEGE